MLVEFYSTIRAKFSVDEHRHYSLTPRNLSAIVYGLIRYDLSDQLEVVYEALTNEINRFFRDKLVNFEAQTKFDGLVGGLIRGHF